MFVNKKFLLKYKRLKLCSIDPYRGDPIVMMWIIQVYDLRKILVSYYIKAIIYYTVRSPRLQVQNKRLLFRHKKALCCFSRFISNYLWIFRHFWNYYLLFDTYSDIYLHLYKACLLGSCSWETIRLLKSGLWIICFGHLPNIPGAPRETWARPMG